MLDTRVILERRWPQTQLATDSLHGAGFHGGLLRKRDGGLKPLQRLQRGVLDIGGDPRGCIGHLQQAEFQAQVATIIWKQQKLREGLWMPPPL